MNPKPADPEGVTSSYGNGTDHKFDQRLRIAIFGDPESSEHAKTRMLIMIDQVVGLFIVRILFTLLTRIAVETPGGCSEAGVVLA